MSLFSARWGIAGSGKICNDFVVSLRTLDPSAHMIWAVAARSKSTASRFADLHQIPEFFEGYDYLAKHDKINVVYIGVVNTEHFNIAKLMLENGKHVLCEKPMCLNGHETKELIDIAKKNCCFLMEAIWSRSFPVYEELKRQIDSDTIGDVVQVNANLGFPISDVERIKSRSLGGGTVLDLGVYVLQFAQFIFPNLKPIRITACGDINEDGVDESCAIIMEFPRKKFAVLSIQSRAVMTNTAEVMGTKGFIKIPDFWCPTRIEGSTSKKRNFSLPDTNEMLFFYHSTGLSYEAEEVRRCLSKGELESPHMTLEQSYELACWRDDIRKQIGVIFDQDLQ